MQCGTGLYYSVDLRIQTYTEPVPLKYEKLVVSWLYEYFYSVWRVSDSLPSHAGSTAGHLLQKVQEGLAVASITRDDPSTLPGDDPSPLPGMHRDHNAR